VSLCWVSLCWVSWHREYCPRSLPLQGNTWKVLPYSQMLDSWQRKVLWHWHQREHLVTDGVVDGRRRSSLRLRLNRKLLRPLVRELDGAWPALRFILDLKCFKDHLHARFRCVFELECWLERLKIDLRCDKSFRLKNAKKRKSKWNKTHTLHRSSKGSFFPPLILKF